VGVETLKSLYRFDLAEGTMSEGFLAGVDEAGRGPLAGPVVAAAVLFRAFPAGSGNGVWKALSDLNDSKQLTARQREHLFPFISRYARVGIGTVHEREIDTLNIFQATRLAMRKAVLNLTCTPRLLLVDGKNMKIDLPLPQKSVIGGDRKSACIAAASVIAKVVRDAWMQSLDTLYPGYHFSRHKGYGTREHLACLERLGPSPVHRQSFAPVRACAGASA